MSWLMMNTTRSSMRSTMMAHDTGLRYSETNHSEIVHGTGGRSEISPESASRWTGCPPPPDARATSPLSVSAPAWSRTTATARPSLSRPTHKVLPSTGTSARCRSSRRYARALADKALTYGLGGASALGSARTCNPTPGSSTQYSAYRARRTSVPSWRARPQTTSPNSAPASTRLTGKVRRPCILTLMTTSAGSCTRNARC